MIHDNSKCTWTRDHIDVYIDGDLDPHDARLLESHLDDCIGCRAETDVARSLVAELRALPELHCPDAVIDAVLDEVGTTGAVRDKAKVGWLARVRTFVTGPTFAPAFAGTFLLLMVASAVFVGKLTRTPHYTNEEIQLAQAQLEWTFGYLGKVSHDAALTVRDDVLDACVARPVTDAFNKTIGEDSPLTTTPTGGH